MLSRRIARLNFKILFFKKASFQLVLLFSRSVFYYFLICSAMLTSHPPIHNKFYSWHTIIRKKILNITKKSKKLFNCYF